MTAFPLDDFLPYRLAVAAARVSRAFEQHYSARAGLSVAEWRILAHLSQEDQVSVRDIVARVDLEKSKVSRAAARLEARGLIRRPENPQDRRLIALSLTPEGVALMADLAPLAAEFQERVTAALGDTAPQVRKGLHRLAEAEL